MRSHSLLQRFVAVAGAAAAVAAFTTLPATAASATAARATAAQQWHAAMAKLADVRAAATEQSRPHITGQQGWTYVVNTTTDSTLYGGAPIHRCQDTANQSQCSYRAAIAVVNDDFDDGGADGLVNDTIVLPAGDIRLSNSVGGGISLESDYSDDLTIRGAGDSKTTIDGTALDFGFELLGLNSPDDSLALSGVEFKGGDETNDAGALWLAAGTIANITDCSFIDNHAQGQGGAIAERDNALLTVTNSTFDGNSSLDGGGAIMTGAYDTTAGLTILSGDTFTDDENTVANSAYNGGAIDSEGPLSVDHSRFTDNTSEYAGGAVFGDGPTVLTDDQFNNNAAPDNGGAIFVPGEVSLTGSTLTDNETEEAGGGITFLGSGSLSDDTFSHNTADEGGGDVAFEGQGTITDSTSSDSSADLAGGSVFAVGESATLTGDSFSGDQATNSSSDDGGGAVYAEAAVSMSDDTIEHCQAKDDGTGGGVLLYTNSAASISQSTISDNTAVSGGGLFASESSGILSGDTINGNTSTWGGGIVDYESTLSIQSSTIDQNKSTDDPGGGIAVDGTDSILTLTDSTVAGNTADVESTSGFGGAIAFNPESAGYLLNDTLVNNKALEGGALYAYEATFQVNDSTIVGNQSTYGAFDGAGTYLDDATMTTTASIWANNVGDACAGDDGYVVVSGGFNLDSDDTCAFASVGDLINDSTAELGALQNNGGPTPTMAPTALSSAIGSGGTACPIADQRGVLVPSAATCDIGAVFVLDTTTKLAFSKSTAKVGDEEAETFIVTVTPSIKGTTPTGTDSVYAGGTLVCKATLKALLGSHTSTAEGLCTTTPSKLKKGTASLHATYNGASLFASGSSTTEKLKVTT